MLRVAAFTIVLVRVASADPVRVDSTGDACDVGDLASQLDRLHAAAPAAASAHVDLRTRGDAVEASVTFDDGNGNTRGPRVVTSASCAELVESVAIVIAMGLPREVAPPRPEVVTDDDDDAEIAVVAQAPPRRRFDTAIVVAGGGGFSTLGVAGVVIAGVRFRRGDGSLGVELRLDEPVGEALGMGGIDVQRTQIAVAPCAHLGSFAACALATAGAIHGAGHGLIDPRSVFTPVVTAGLRATWEHPITNRFAIRAHIDGDAALTTTQFDVDYMRAWLSPRFEASAGFGVLAQFP